MTPIEKLREALRVTTNALVAIEANCKENTAADLEYGDRIGVGDEWRLQNTALRELRRVIQVGRDALSVRPGPDARDARIAALEAALQCPADDTYGGVHRCVRCDSEVLP